MLMTREALLDIIHAAHLVCPMYKGNLHKQIVNSKKSSFTPMPSVSLAAKMPALLWVPLPSYCPWSI